MNSCCHLLPSQALGLHTLLGKPPGCPASCLSISVSVRLRLSSGEKPRSEDPDWELTQRVPLLPCTICLCISPFHEGQVFRKNVLQFLFQRQLFCLFVLHLPLLCMIYLKANPAISLLCLSMQNYPSVGFSLSCPCHACKRKRTEGAGGRERRTRICACCL